MVVYTLEQGWEILLAIDLQKKTRTHTLKSHSPRIQALPKRVTVCYRFWSRGIIGPFVFENEQGEAVTVNGNHYRAMLNEFLFTKIKEEDIAKILFQQNGATCHTAEAALYVLRPVFEELKRRILMTFGFNRTALRATQPKLRSMFCNPFLKIALSAAELMSFGHLGAAIWQRWTIICGVLSKISVKPTSQRPLML